MKTALIIVVILSVIKALVPNAYYATNIGPVLLIGSIVALIAYVIITTKPFSSKKRT